MNHWIKLTLTSLVILLTACGGGSSSADSSGSSPTDNIGGSDDNLDTNLSQVNVSGQAATFNFSDVETLLEYDDIVEQTQVPRRYERSPNTFKLEGFGSNILAVNNVGETVYPIENIEPLFVEYSVVHPDGSKLYLSLKSNEEYYYTSHGLLGEVQLLNPENEDSYQTLNFPIIGSPNVVDFPFTNEMIEAIYGSGAYLSWNHVGTWDDEFDNEGNYISSSLICPESAIEVDRFCFDQLSIYSTSDGVSTLEKTVNAKEFYSQVLKAFEESYISCSVIEYDRLTGNTDCLGGSHLQEVGIYLQGLGWIPVQMPVQNLQKFNSSWYSSLEKFDQIREGLKPIQFDNEGNIYTLAYRYLEENEWYWGVPEIVKIDPENNLSSIIEFDTLSIERFVVFNNGDVAYEWYDRESTYGISIYKDGNHLILTGDDYYPGDNSFSADHGNTLVVNNSIIYSNESGGYDELPLTWNGNEIDSIQLSDDGYMYGCISYYDNEYKSRIVSVLPFLEAPVLENCDYGMISRGHQAIAKEYELVGYGTSEFIQIKRLSDQIEYQLLKAESPKDARYRITTIAYGAGSVMFSGLRTTAPASAVIGEINISKLSQGLDESEYLVINDVSSAVAANNTVRKITPLPVIEGLSGAAPKVTDVFFNKYDHSQIGLQFSEFMNKAKVMEALSLSQENESVPYIPFWINKNLFLIADTNGFGDANGDSIRDGKDYQSYLPNKPYQLDLDTSVAIDLADRLMASSTAPNSSHTFTFENQILFEFSEGVAELINKDIYGQKTFAETVGSSESSYFKFATQNQTEEAPILRVNFDLLAYTDINNGKLMFDLEKKNSYKWFFAISESNNQREASSQRMYLDGMVLSKWEAPWPVENYNDAEDYLTSKASAIGFYYFESMAAAPSDDYSFNYDPEYFPFNSSDSNSNELVESRWLSYELEITDSELILKVKNADGSYIELHRGEKQQLGTGDQMEFWLSFSLDNLNYRLDNLSISQWNADSSSFEVIKSSDFNAGIEEFPGLQENATAEFWGIH